ncbi:dsDNA nuclease domain-containing protein [Aurantivibrio plasticivorans]
MDHFEELIEIVNDAGSEVGGGHGQKGVDFQRYWAISTMFSLVGGSDDFLVLFEVIQDVAIYDSLKSPTNLKIFQIKKKDRNEWGWKDLTGLYVPSKKNGKPQPFEKVKESTIGKLYTSVSSLKNIEVSGHFVSNAGCNLSLTGGGNAATTAICYLSDLEEEHRKLLVDALAMMGKPEDLPPDLTKIQVSKTSIPVDDPRTYLVGEIHSFLNKRSPKHANQAHSLVDSLLAKIGPLGAKTDRCMSFSQLAENQGFSRSQFENVLSDLETVPDILDHLNEWLKQLQDEGLSFFEITSIKSAASELYRNQLLGTRDYTIQSLENRCDELIGLNSDPKELKPFFESMFSILEKEFPDVRKPAIFAVIALRAIKSCVDQI